MIMARVLTFYVNATQAPWADNYQMYDYVVSELPALIESELPINSRRSVTGHSMGARCVGCRLAQPGYVPVGIGIFADLCADTMPLG